MDRKAFAEFSSQFWRKVESQWEHLEVQLVATFSRVSATAAPPPLSEPRAPPFPSDCSSQFCKMLRLQK